MSLKADLKECETDRTTSTIMCKKMLSSCCWKTKLLEFHYVFYKFWVAKIRVKYLVTIIYTYNSNILLGRIFQKKLLMGIGKSFAIDLDLSSPSQVK